MPLSLQLVVSSPCTGAQFVNKVSSQLYTGTAGDFTFALLSRDSSATRWTMVMYDFDRSTACSPTRTYIQDPGDALDPNGTYHGQDANGDPDPTLGSATASEF